MYTLENACLGVIFIVAPLNAVPLPSLMCRDSLCCPELHGEWPFVLKVCLSEHFALLFPSLAGSATWLPILE